MKRGENPTVNLGAVFHLDLRRGWVKSINVSIECEERIGIVERTKELTTHLVYTIRIKLEVVPWFRVGHHIEAHRIGSVSVNHFKGIDHITYVFAHFVSFRVKHESRRDHVLECHTVEHHRGDGVQSKKPAACLINTFVDKVGRKSLSPINRIAILERIMHLCIGHCSRVKPNVDKIGLAIHRFTTLAHKHNLIYIRTMQVYLFVIFLCKVTRYKSFLFHRIGYHHTCCHTLLYLSIQLFERTNANLLTIFVTPNGKRRTPKTRTREIPIV